MFPTLTFLAVFPVVGRPWPHLVFILSEGQQNKVQRPRVGWGGTEGVVCSKATTQLLSSSSRGELIFMKELVLLRHCGFWSTAYLGIPRAHFLKQMSLGLIPSFCSFRTPTLIAISTWPSRGFPKSHDLSPHTACCTVLFMEELILHRSCQG